jgi:hypothetical protein
MPARPLHPREIYPGSLLRQTVGPRILRALPERPVRDRGRDLAPDSVSQHRVHDEATAGADRIPLPDSRKPAGESGICGLNGPADWRRRTLPTLECRTAMCEKCVKLDSKIDHYRFLASRLTDQLTIHGIKQLIDRIQAEKAALHPDQKQ